jgi:prepilin-type N-terminal cleavage/methylation domain-containing protein
MDAAIAPIKTAVSPKANQAKRGFTLIEVLVSMVVITVGLISLLAAFGVAMQATNTAREDMIAKQLAQEAMESIVTARETANVTWAAIQNVGPAGAIFVTGLQPIRQAGADGIIGTADDAAAPAETMNDPGPDGIVGTADDGAPIPLTKFQRQIVIGPTATPDLRTVTITVQYTTTRNVTRSYILSGMVSQYRQRGFHALEPKEVQSRFHPG